MWLAMPIRMPFKSDVGHELNWPNNFNRRSTVWCVLHRTISLSINLASFTLLVSNPTVSNLLLA
jgi:hypothetical protein